MNSSIKNSNSPHFWWLISIFTITIILLISFILTNRMVYADKIMEYISYASVILSITLSIFALLYTYTSNVQIQQQFEKINSAAENITSASDNLKVTTNKFDDNLHTILNRLESIDVRQQEISNNINDTLGNNALRVKNIPNQPNKVKKE